MASGSRQGFADTPELRRRIMASNKARDTKPELIVRSKLHAAGFRYRLHRRDLPGSPDLVLPRYRTAVFVNGCFWHGHHCKADRPPKTNAGYWTAKIAENVERDRRNVSRLREAGWEVVEIYECEMPRAIDRLLDRLRERRSTERVDAEFEP